MVLEPIHARGALQAPEQVALLVCVGSLALLPLPIVCPLQVDVLCSKGDWLHVLFEKVVCLSSESFTDVRSV